MAWLSAGLHGEQWMISEIGDGNIAIIENPGQDDEKVHFKYNGRNSRETLIIKEKLNSSELLTRAQKIDVAFWMGYFYAHLSHNTGSVNG